MGRSRIAGGDRRSRRRAHDRRHADAGAGHVAGSGSLYRPAAVADDPEGRLSRGARGHDHGRAARDRAHFRRDRAASVHRAEQPVLEPQSECSGFQPAGRYLPVRAQSLQ